MLLENKIAVTRSRGCDRGRRRTRLCARWGHAFSHRAPPGLHRNRHPEYEDSWCASGRSGRRTVLAADFNLREVVLHDCTHGGTADGCESIRSDHDRHSTPLAHGHPIGWRLRSGDGCHGGTHSRSIPELASHGIRVVGLRPQAMPETPTIKDAFEPRAKASGMTWEQWQEFLASKTHARRLMSLDELAQMAVFMASDRASGMTGTIVNLTMGSLDD